MNLKKIAVLGAGSWGCTLAGLLADKGYDVSLWHSKEKEAARLQTSRQLSTLPQLRLPASISISASVKESIQDRAFLIAAVPSHRMRATVQAVVASRALAPGALFVTTSKGLEEKSGSVMSHVIRDELHGLKNPIVVLSGPSHAEEVCRKLPTAVVASGLDSNAVGQTQELFNTDFFRVYKHQDPLGVELAGALKNIYAIACGISDGLGFGDNTRAAIMARGLNEMVRIGVKMGAEMLTFFGLAGMGDLSVTCLSSHSRNHELGKKIGGGLSAERALASMTMIAEGYRTASAAHGITERLQLDCPLTKEIYEVLYRGKNPKASLRDLMMRAPQSEWRDVIRENERGRS